MSPLLHLAHAATWTEAQRLGFYAPPSLEREGFIHLCTEAQLSGVVERFYQGQRDMLLLTIDPTRLHAELRYEESEPDEAFPHLYGALNLDAVIAVRTFA
jgi:uncharacterized protein (DUF952 family)